MNPFVAQNPLYMYLYNRMLMQNAMNTNFPMTQINKVQLPNPSANVPASIKEDESGNLSAPEVPSVSMNILTKYKDIYVPSIYMLDYNDISKNPLKGVVAQIQNQNIQYNGQSNTILNKYFNYGYTFDEWKIYVSQIRKKFDELNDLVKNGSIKLPEPDNELEYLMAFPSDYGGLGNIHKDQLYENVKFFDPKDTTRNSPNKNIMNIIQFESNQTWFPLESNQSSINKPNNDFNYLNLFNNCIKYPNFLFGKTMQTTTIPKINPPGIDENNSGNNNGKEKNEKYLNNYIIYNYSEQKKEDEKEENKEDEKEEKMDESGKRRKKEESKPSRRSRKESSDSYESSYHRNKRKNRSREKSSYHSSRSRSRSHRKNHSRSHSRDHRSRRRNEDSGRSGRRGEYIKDDDKRGKYSKERGKREEYRRDDRYGTYERSNYRDRSYDSYNSNNNRNYYSNYRNKKNYDYYYDDDYNRRRNYYGKKGYDKRNNYGKFNGRDRNNKF